MPTWIIALVAIVCIVGGCVGLYAWLKVFNGPDGERYRKLRMQGPFVPLSEAEIREDEERMQGRKTSE